MPSFSGLNVQCPQCKRVMHTTTALYDPDKTAKGNMVELLPKWKKRGWRTFYGGGGSTTPAAAMQCPHCSGRLAPSGKLRIKPEPKPVKTQAQKNQEAIDEGFKESVRTQADLNQEKIDSFQPISTSLMEQVVEIVEKPQEAKEVRHQDKTYTCKVCGKLCKSKLGLHSHMRSHRNE